MRHDVGVVCLCAMCDSYFLVIVSQVYLSLSLSLWFCVSMWFDLLS